MTMPGVKEKRNMPDPNTPAAPQNQGPAPTYSEAPMDGTKKPAEAKDGEGKAPEPWRNEAEVKKIIADRDAWKLQHRQTLEEYGKYKQYFEEHERVEAEAREKAQRTKAEQEGRYQDIIAANETKFKAELAKRENMYAERMIPHAIKSAAAEIPNLTREALGDLPNLLRDSLALDTDDMQVKVMGPDGKAVLDEHGKPLDVQQYIHNFVQSRPYLLIDAMPRSHGAGKQQLGGEKAEPPPNISQMLNDPASMRAWQERDPEGFAKAYAEAFTPAGLKAMAAKRLQKK